MVLRVDKMRRLFFFSETKYFSISFPFFIKKDEDNQYTIYSNEIVIDPELISHVKGIINCNKFDAHCSSDFIEPIWDYEKEHEGEGIKIFWTFFKNLLLMEDGYIRYDYDEERHDGHKHPLNHYDLFYSNNCTFKIGLSDKIEENELIDLIDITTDCKYLCKQPTK